MTGVILEAQPAGLVDARARNVSHALRAILDLGEWVEGERNSPPDLSRLDPKLTQEVLKVHKSDLVLWKEMFSESLDNYRDLLDMTPAEWAALTDRDVVGLEGMLRQATNGIVLWI